MALRRTVRLAGLTLLAGALSVIPVASASAAAQLKGAGSTLIAPLEAEWGPAWAHVTNNTAPTYDPVGSGTGLQEIGEGLVDFGASDAPLSAATTPCSGCFQIPWGLTATGVTYNVSGVSHLKLTGKILAGIYLGQITTWNNKAIRKVNKGVHLPAEKITPIHRSDGSGDSYAFTDYLSKVSKSFRSRVGRGTKPAFPTGVGAQGNSGMVQAVNSTPGSIAYVAVTYLIINKIRAAAIQNAAGKFEYPNYKNIANAAASAHIPANREIHIVNPAKRYKKAYPISTFTYAILKSTDPLGNGAELKSFVSWAVTTGQAFAAPLDFVPLPSRVVNADKGALGLIH